MRSWAAERDEAVTWVTVDRDERDAQRFWINLIEALADAAGDEVVERVSAAPRFAGAVVVERLLTQLERLEDPLELVIEDNKSNPTEAAAVAEKLVRAVRETVDFLASQKMVPLDRYEAYSITSMTADCRVTQVVDIRKGVHCMVPKSIFTKKK